MHVMMRLVAITQAFEDAHCLLFAWLLHHYRLEATLESGILFQVFAVFVERGSADNLNFATRQGRLQNGSSIDGAFSGASADKGVQLVDEQDDVASLLNFLNALLQTLFEFATVLGACHQCRYVKRDDAHIANDIGYLVGNDKLSQAFGNSGFAHAGLTDKEWVVLLATREDLHHALDFASSPDYGIEFAVLGLFGEVDTKFLQHAVGSARVGIEIGSAREHRRLTHHIV